LTTGSGSSPLTAAASTAYTFTVTVANSGETYGGIDIASYSGNGLSAGSGLYASGGELTHSSPQSFSGGSTSWTFTYTTGSTDAWDTIYATGNAVDHTGLLSCTHDAWNNASKFIIHTYVPASIKRFALGRTSIALGSVRVGRRKADSVHVTSTGADPITINSNAIKGGAPFSSYSPGSTPRTLTTPATEVDSVIFQPTARGTFSDSLIFTTNSDITSDQRKGLAVSGQGIQAVFSNAASSLAFGNLRINRTKTMAFPFSNSGDDTMFYSVPTISGSGFTISQAPHQSFLISGGFDTVIVQFAPTLKQSYSGSLVFAASNGVSAPTISLSGAGIVPQLQFSTPASIGGSRVGTTRATIVTLLNTGNDTLHVSNASLAQAGTKFTLGAYDQTVLPSAQGSFHIQYLPTAERTDSATIHFTTDDPSNTSPAIIVIANGVLPHMSIVEHDTVDLGTIKVGDVSTHVFTINNTGGDALTINTANTKAGPAPFTLASGGSTFISVGTSGSVTVNFNPTAVGSFTGSLVVAGDDPNNPSDTIPLKGSAINSSLTIAPSNATFGSVPVSTTLFDTISLTNTGAAAVKISSATLTPSSTVFVVVSSPSQVSGNSSARIILSFTPQSAIVYSDVLTLVTDDNSAPTRTISISGTGIKGALSVTPALLDFGNVDTGKSQSFRAVLKNTGTASVIINSVSVTPVGTAFSFTPVTTPATIAAGDSLPITVKFTPINGGSQSAAISVKLADNSLVTVQLQGVGVVKQNGVAASPVSTFTLSLSPNPARESSSLVLQLKQDIIATMRVFDALGHEVRSSSLGPLSGGEHRFNLETNSLPSGSYFVRIEGSNGEVVEGRLVIDR
jgi:hypothetical protein